MTNYETAKTIKDPEKLRKLSKDFNSVVRWGVAENPNTPQDALEGLSKDSNWCVRWGVADNPNITETVMASIVDGEYNKNIIKALYKNKSIPERIKKMIYIKTGIK